MVKAKYKSILRGIYNKRKYWTIQNFLIFCAAVRNIELGLNICYKFSVKYQGILRSR